ncbi:MAG: Fic family protein [Lachnospiraceae bacterium]
MKDKFNITQEQNILLAIRNLADYIWKSANLEGIPVTFPETYAILNGINVSSVNVEGVVTINNLKHAWQFVIDTVDYIVDYSYICKLHQYIGANLIYGAGNIGIVPIRINKTERKPEFLVQESIIMEDLQDIFQIEGITEQAVTLMLYLMRKQLFLAGNKLVAMLSANQIMISHGKGVISVPQKYHQEFMQILVEYFETGKKNRIENYIYETSIEG